MHFIVGTLLLKLSIYFGLETKKWSFHVYKAPIAIITILNKTEGKRPPRIKTTTVSAVAFCSQCTHTHSHP